MKGIRPLRSPGRTLSGGRVVERLVKEPSCPDKAPRSLGRRASRGGRPGRGPRFRKRLGRVLAALVLFSALRLSAGLEASQVRLLNLEEMTQRAATIFSGRCVALSTLVDPDLGREVTVATFQVSRAVKGTDHGTITIRMPASADVASGVGGLPTFHKGDEVVLFLYGKSQLGFRAPVGLGQGNFRVLKDKRGRATAVNDLGNRNLLRGLSAPARERIAAKFDLRRPEESLTPVDLLGMAESILRGSDARHPGNRP